MTSLVTAATTHTHTNVHTYIQLYAQINSYIPNNITALPRLPQLILVAVDRAADQDIARDIVVFAH